MYLLTSRQAARSDSVCNIIYWVLRANVLQTKLYVLGSLAIWYSYSIIILGPLSNPTALSFSVSVAICICQQLANEIGICRSIVTGIVLLMFYLFDSSPF